MSNELLTPAPLDVQPRHDPKTFIMVLSLVIVVLTAAVVVATQFGWSNL